MLPSTEWKRRAYRKPEQQRWYAGETISLGIGQGYNSFTILQMAQAAATLAGAASATAPHLVREVSGRGHRRRLARGPPSRCRRWPIKPEHLEVIRHALVGVNIEGTSATAFRGAGYQAAGKTGTAQVVGIKQNEKYNAAKMAEHLRDHALYVAYAPAEPAVALALVVENAGFGAQSAAPIARRVFDYWLLLGQWPSDEDIAATAEGKSTAPMGKRRAGAAGACRERRDRRRRPRRWRPPEMAPPPALVSGAPAGRRLRQRRHDRRGRAPACGSACARCWRLRRPAGRRCCWCWRRRPADAYWSGHDQGTASPTTGATWLMAGADVHRWRRCRRSG